MKKIKEVIPYIIIIIVVVLVRTYLFTPAIVSGSSMEDTLHNNELVLVNKIALKDGINRFDIVIVEVENSLLIKRVIALPNEKIEYKNNELYINDEKIETKEYPETFDFKAETKNNEYYLLGDNRGVSKDSRILGAFNKEKIKGKVNIILFPFKRFGNIE